MELVSLMLFQVEAFLEEQDEDDHSYQSEAQLSTFPSFYSKLILDIENIQNWKSISYIIWIKSLSF